MDLGNLRNCDPARKDLDLITYLNNNGENSRL